MSDYIVAYYQQGQNAFLAGDLVSDNPFDPGSAPYWSWESGYTEAWYEEFQKQFNEYESENNRV